MLAIAATMCGGRVRIDPGTLLSYLQHHGLNAKAIDSIHCTARTKYAGGGYLQNCTVTYTD